MSKKIFCLLIALLMLLTISCASAAEDLDNSTLDTVDEQDAVQSTIDDASLEIENVNDIDEVLSDPADSNGTGESNYHITANVNEYGDISIIAEADPAAGGELSIKITNSSGDVLPEVYGQLENGEYVLGDLGFNLAKGEYMITSHYYGDTTFAPRNSIAYLTIAKDIAGLDVNASVSMYGAIVINATLNKAATGNVTFRIVREDEDPDLSTDVNVTVENGTAIYDELAPFLKGNYTVHVIYSGDDNYYMAYDGPRGLEVNKTEVIPKVVNLKVESNAVEFTVDLFVPATGEVHATYPDGTVHNLTIENGQVKFWDIIDEFGSLSIVLDYDGDENYYGFYEFYVDFFVKYLPDLNVTANVDKYGMIEIFTTVNKNATGIVFFKIFNSTGSVIIEGGARIENGTANFTELSQYAKGEYIILATYDGDDMFQEDSNTATVGINKTYITPVTEMAKVTGRYVDFIVDLGVPATGNINVVYYNGNKENWPINDYENRTRALSVFPDYGRLYVVLDYDGDSNYYGFYQYYIDFTTKHEAELKVDTSINEYGVIVVNSELNKNATGAVSVKIINSAGAVVIEGTEDIENGSATYYELVQYQKGVYTIEVTYPGDDYNEAATNSTQCEVTKTAPTMDYTVKVTGGEVVINIKLPSDINGKLIALYPSGYLENVTIVNGSATIHNVFMNETGDLAITATFEGNDQYYATFEIIGFYIKQATMVDANAVSVVYQNNAKVTVKLTNLVTGKAIAGEPVEITVNGKTYKGTTDKNGNAVITIPAKMIPKKYTARVAYKGSATLESDFVDVAFTVKKATPKVTAKKKTFKKSVKVKKYTITLKDNKGKAIKKAKVTIKVGKKTFKAKTNAKGKAVFKLKKLTKKAKYNAKVTYKGNKYFNKVTKKVKIIIK